MYLYLNKLASSINFNGFRFIWKCVLVRFRCFICHQVVLQRVQPMLSFTQDGLALLLLSEGYHICFLLLKLVRRLSLIGILSALVFGYKLIKTVTYIILNVSYECFEEFPVISGEGNGQILVDCDLVINFSFRVLANQASPG